MRLRPGQLVAAVAALAIIAGAAALAQTSAGQSALRGIGVAAPSARYTELAFTHPARLPKHISQAPSRLPAAFTITNHERAAVTYHWQVSMTQPVARVLSAGDVYVPRGQLRYVDPTIVLGCSRRTQIRVQLTSGQSISYYVDCIPSPVRSQR